MRTNLPIRVRAIDLFATAGVTRTTFEKFDAVVLAQIATEVVKTLRIEYGNEDVLDFINASFTGSSSIASILGCGTRARGFKREKRG